MKYDDFLKKKLKEKVNRNLNQLETTRQILEKEFFETEDDGRFWEILDELEKIDEMTERANNIYNQYNLWKY